MVQFPWTPPDDPWVPMGAGVGGSGVPASAISAGGVDVASGASATFTFYPGRGRQVLGVMAYAGAVSTGPLYVYAYAGTSPVTGIFLGDGWLRASSVAAQSGGLYLPVHLQLSSEQTSQVDVVVRNDTGTTYRVQVVLDLR